MHYIRHKSSTIILNPGAHSKPIIRPTHDGPMPASDSKQTHISHTYIQRDKMRMVDGGGWGGLGKFQHVSIWKWWKIPEHPSRSWANDPQPWPQLLCLLPLQLGLFIGDRPVISPPALPARLTCASCRVLLHTSSSIFIVPYCIQSSSVSAVPSSPVQSSPIRIHIPICISLIPVSLINQNP